MTLAGWGNYPRIRTRLLRARGAAEASAALAGTASLIARGNGRAYGDAALNPQATLSMLPSDRILDFDPQTGCLTCEAGLLLAEIIALFLPRGWFPPVTPGTKFVSIGGMIAADVHGKNHHGAGTFGDHVESLDLLLADGRIVRCARDENAELFQATRGGMGLTGIILRARFRLMPVETAAIRQQTVKAANLAEAMAQFEEFAQWRYAVAWIDCLARGSRLGRALLHLGDHAVRDELSPASRGAPLSWRARRPVTVPVDLPRVVLNRWSIGAFNELHYRAGRAGQSITDHEGFFYPLDALLAWNRLYGRGGFVQYQCVLPLDAGAAGMAVLLDRIAASGRGSFLAVLKRLGPQNDALLSFPMAGWTLALDFPADRASLALLPELDAVVADHGGRLYLAKDAASGPGHLDRYPGLAAFRAVRRRIDPDGRFTSLQSQRLGL